MRWAAPIAALALAACAADSDPACVNHAALGIVNGTGAPSIVTLAPRQQRAIAFLASPTGACTAVIVREQWAVTAGHCANLPQNLTLWVGQEPVAMVDMQLHERLDVAWLRLEAPIAGDSGRPLLVPGPAVAGVLTRGAPSCLGQDVYIAAPAFARSLPVNGASGTGGRP